MLRSIAVDAGKFDTKAVMEVNGELKSVRFRTKVEPSNADTILNRDSHIVEYNGIRYVVGDEASDKVISFDLAKKTEQNRIATYTAIGLLAESGDTINLVIGCPINIFSNSDARVEYKDYIAPREEIRITIDGKTKYFAIRKSFVCEEASGPIYLEIKKYLKSSVGVIDIGGLNCNCMLYENVSPRKELCFTDELGSNVLMLNARKEMEAKFSESINSVTLNTLKTNGCFFGPHKDESRKIFNRLKEDHVNAIFKACKDHGWNLDMMQFIFTGGSSIFLKDTIKAIVDKAGYETNIDQIEEGAEFINARGFLKYLAMVV